VEEYIEPQNDRDDHVMFQMIPKIMHSKALPSHKILSTISLRKRLLRGWRVMHISLSGYKTNQQLFGPA
jgi:hypothetical protein